MWREGGVFFMLQTVKIDYFTVCYFYKTKPRPKSKMSDTNNSCSVSFTFMVYPENSRMFGKIDCYVRRDEDAPIDVHIKKIIVRWFNYLRKTDPALPELDVSKICVGVLGIYPDELLRPTSMERGAFDFYYDAWMGIGYMRGNEIKQVW